MTTFAYLRSPQSPASGGMWGAGEPDVLAAPRESPEQSEAGRGERKGSHSDGLHIGSAASRHCVGTRAGSTGSGLPTTGTGTVAGDPPQPGQRGEKG